MFVPRAYCWGFIATAEVGQLRACRALADQHHLLGATAWALAAVAVAIALLATLFCAPLPTAAELGPLLFPVPRKG